MGSWIFIFFIIVIVVTSQDIIAGAALTILGIIFFLLFSADNKKHLSQIKTIQAFRLKYIQNIEHYKKRGEPMAILLVGRTLIMVGITQKM